MFQQESVHSYTDMRGDNAWTVLDNGGRFIEVRLYQNESLK
jgi:hypothetical protein